MSIDQFLFEERGKPHEWGDTDCCSTANRWVFVRTGKSPLDIYGRVPKNEADAKEWLGERGSIAVAVNRVMRKSGFKKTPSPKSGDVGLIIVDQQLCMAIFDGSFWHSRSEQGFLASRGFWKAWSI